MSAALLPAVELLDAYRTKRVSPVEAVDACLRQIERYGDAFNAFVLVDPEAARRAARDAESRWLRGEPAGALDGVPVTIKDLILTRGWPTPARRTTPTRRKSVSGFPVW